MGKSGECYRNLGEKAGNLWKRNEVKLFFKVRKSFKL